MSYGYGPAQGIQSGGGGGGGTAGALEETKANETGSPLPEGGIVAQDPANPGSVLPLDITGPTDSAASRPTGVVSQAGGIAGSGGTGTVVTTGPGSVLLRPGLTPLVGDLVIGSNVDNEGTIPGSGVDEPGVGDWVQSIGTITDLQGYDGVTALRVGVQIQFGWRRLN